MAEQGVTTHVEALNLFNAITCATITPVTHSTYQELTDETEAYVSRTERLEGDLNRERAISARLAAFEGPGHRDASSPSSPSGGQDWTGVKLAVQQISRTGRTDSE